nr:serine/threonine-protein kinase VRK2-like [Parasteatoda tepidariorum]
MAGRGGARKKTAAKGYQLPEPIPEGYEISDTTKKSWLIGTQIGSGGFGTVYFASSKEKPKELNYVIKVVSISSKHSFSSFVLCGCLCCFQKARA